MLTLPVKVKNEETEGAMSDEEEIDIDTPQEEDEDAEEDEEGVEEEGEEEEEEEEENEEDEEETQLPDEEDEDQTQDVTEEEEGEEEEEEEEDGEEMPQEEDVDGDITMEADDDIDEGDLDLDSEEESYTEEHVAIRMEACVFNRMELDLPVDMIQKKEVFNQVFSVKMWQGLTEMQRRHLMKFLPSFGTDDMKEKQSTLRKLFHRENFKFGNPIQKFQADLKAGLFSPDIAKYRTLFKKAKYKEYIYQQQEYYTKLLKDILVSRQRVLEQLGSLTPDEKLKPLPRVSVPPKEKSMNYRMRKKYQSILKSVQEECNADVSSEEEDAITVPGIHMRRQLLSPSKQQDTQQQTSGVISTLSPKPGKGVERSTSPITVDDEDLKALVRKHRKRRLENEDSPDLDTRGITLQDIIVRTQPNNKRLLKLHEAALTAEQGPAVQMKMAVPRKPRADDKERKKKRLKLKIPKAGEAPLGQQMPPGGASVKETDEYDFSSDMGPAFGHPYAQPVVKRNFGVYASFFSLLRDFISESSESKVTTTKLEQQVLEWQNSPSSKLNVWVSMEKNWVELVSSALKFLSGDILGLTLEKFIPLVDFKERAQIWKWIGQGHDNDAYLTMLCTHWLEQRKQSILESGDANDEVPPARVKTDFVVRPTTDMEKVVFRAQELERFSSPHKAFTYKLHGYESTVGPVKGVYNKESPMNKAREHNLLVNERPAYVTILTLVRDSAARLPNGEGTRADICELLKDSQFLSPGVSDAQVNTVVSGALDRLHYEKDPCVKYDVNRKLWIYLHRSRSEEEFELIHQAHGAAAKAKRAMQKPKATKSRAKEPTTVTTIPPPQTQAAEDAAAVEALFQGQVPASQANSPRVVTLTPGMVRMTPPSPQTSQASQRGMETVFLQPGQRFAPQGMLSQNQPGTVPSSGTPTQSLYQIGGQRMTSSPRQTVVGNKPYSYSIVQSQGLPGQGSPQTAGKTVLVTQPHPGGSPQQQLQTSPRAVSASPTVGVTSQPSTPTTTPSSSSPKPSPATSSGASSPLIARIVQQGPRGTQLMSVGNLLAAVQKQQSAPQGQGATTIKIQGTNIVHQVSGKPTHVISGGKPGGATAGGGKPITLTHVGGKPATLLQPGGKPATVLMSSMARNTSGGKPTQIVYSAGKPGQMGGKPLTMVTQIGGKPVAIATQSPEKQQPVTGQTRMVMGGKPVQIGGKPVYLTTSKQGFSGKPAAMTRLTTTSGSSILQTQRNQPVTPGSPRTGSPKVVMSPVQAGLILTQLAQGQGGKPAAQIKQTSSQSGGNSTQFIMQTGQGQTKVISPHQIVSQGGKPQNIQVLRTVLTQAGGKPGQTTFVITQAGLQQSQGGSTSQEGTQEEARGVTKTTTASVKVSKPGSAPVYARIITPPPGVRLTAVTQSQATPTQATSVIQTSGKIQTSAPPVTKPS